MTSANQSERIIRSGFIALVFIAIGAALGFCSEPNGAESNGSPTSFEHAIADSQQSGKPIMLVFTGSDWCMYCKLLDREVIDTTEFSNWSRQIVHLEIDFPQMTSLPESLAQRNNDLMEKYGVHVSSYPTVLFVGGDGEVIGKTGYIPGGAQNWIGNAELILSNAGHALRKSPTTHQAVATK